MFRSWKVGTAFGIGIYVHWTFLLLMGFVLLGNWGQHGLHAAFYAVFLLLAVFGCVVLHELGHAVMARRFGIPTRDITLYPIGGVARLEWMSERPLEEVCIALAGPAVNVVLAFLLLGVSAVIGIPLPSAAGMSGNSKVPYLVTLAATNLGLVLFNLLPAFPMDGGRVLRALLVPALGRLPATRVAANVGSALALLLMLAGSWLNPLLLLVGAFIFLAGRHELWALRRQEWVRRAEPRDVLPVAGELLDLLPVLTRSSRSGASGAATTKAWVVWTNGQGVQTYGIE